MGLLIDGVTTHPIPPMEGVALVSRVAAVCGRPLVATFAELLSGLGPASGVGGREAIKASLVASVKENPSGLLASLGQAMDALAHPSAAPLVIDLCRYASVERGGVPMRCDTPAMFNAVFQGDPSRAFAVALEVAIEQGLFSRSATSLVGLLSRAKVANDSPSASSTTS